MYVHNVWQATEWEHVSPLRWQFLSWPIALSYSSLNSDPLAQHCSPFRGLQQIFSWNEGLRRNFKSYRHSHSNCLFKCCISWKLVRAVGGDFLQLVWNFNPTVKHSHAEWEYCQFWVNWFCKFVRSLFAHLNAKFTFTSIFPALHQASTWHSGFRAFRMWVRRS